MTDIVLTPVTSGYNLSRINNNFQIVQDSINNDVLHLNGGNNTMSQSLDMNSHKLLNLSSDPDDPDSVLTVAVADALYYNVDGDQLTGPMDVNGQVVSGLKVAVAPTDAMRKQEFDQEVVARQSADNALQDQLNGTNPPMGSAFSPISWHDQVVATSVTIPANKNAWSFGPVLTIAPGQLVTVGANSFWTIANGEVQ